MAAVREFPSYLAGYDQFFLSILFIGTLEEFFYPCFCHYFSVFFHPTHSWDVKHLVNKSFVLCGGTGIRTQDTWVSSPMRCPLHYGCAALMLSPKRLSFDHTEAQCFYHSMVVSAIPCRRMLACTRSAVATDGERHAGIIHSRKHPSAISYVWSDRFSDKFQSGSGGIRTQDPWIPSPTLYR